MEEFDEADVEDALNKDGDDNLAKRENEDNEDDSDNDDTKWMRMMMMKPNGAT